MHAAQEFRSRRDPLPEGSHWALVRACLRWSDVRRIRMPEALQEDSWLNACVDAADRQKKSPVEVAESPVVAGDVHTAVCACRGRCRKNQHSVNGGCLSTELVSGTSYCIECVCGISGCGRPKDRSAWCIGHKKLVDSLPKYGQLAITAALHARHMRPADVEDGEKSTCAHL